MTSLFAIVDCNNFYASCERVFNPALNGRPVVVLSNNDGCIIALSNEAKALGIKMGTPYFQARPQLEKDGVAVFSSNYELYGDMSRRVVETLQQFTPNLEVYSIDESFLDLGDFYKIDLQSYAKTIKETVFQWTGIPVAVGVATTKTLAKVANRLSKKSTKADGVLVLTDERHIEAALKRTDVGSVWGIGRRYATKLAGLGIHTAWDLRNVTDGFAKKHLTVVGLRTVKELRGESCMELEHMPPAKQNICTSRSFGETLTELTDLEEALATHTVRCAMKLRKQKSCAGVITVFLMTNRFTEQHYYYSRTIKLDSPTSSELDLLRHATRALKQLYRPGLQYKKAGVIVSDIVPANQVQLSLLSSQNTERDTKLMHVLDDLREKYGNKFVKYGVQGTGKKWQLKEEHISACYTTDLSGLLKVG
ncbi:Y-family DNA polymerase [Pontibacter sp. BT310]|uniref:Y-family DNA polymerase n=1 Tax=Pontibacter populi TaxID=890055 RepID=A0ABS6XEP0_9BACT|nr:MULTISPECIES: Y-family DNA polymerase [Pontibacter]MBJ6119502.1 Y-family DNA polymerase [Pontibacter sp. BT310]MBR0571930.1 Y-family DNA polymerase [Microvirga sp. STS03]MBW3366356.1 Y-family DNA polymerase [Pontibacter populi]